MSDFTKREEALIKAAAVKTESRIQAGINRVPLLGPLLAAIGVASLFYGIEKLLDQTPIANQPIPMIMLGVIILLLTGAYYRKL